MCPLPILYSTLQNIWVTAWSVSHVCLCVSLLSLLISCLRWRRRPSDCQRKSKPSTGRCLPSQVGVTHTWTWTWTHHAFHSLCNLLFVSLNLFLWFQETASGSSSSAWPLWPSRPTFCPSWRKVARGTWVTSSVSRPHSVTIVNCVFQFIYQVTSLPISTPVSSDDTYSDMKTVAVYFWVHPVRCVRVSQGLILQLQLKRGNQFSHDSCEPEQTHSVSCGCRSSTAEIKNIQNTNLCYFDNIFSHLSDLRVACGPVKSLKTGLRCMKVVSSRG